jgi:AraC-like DNA-binding protein
MTHLSIVSTLMDFLAEIGGPVESGLAAAGMPTRIIDDRRGYVPCRTFCHWVAREGRREGLDNFGLQSVMRAGVGGLQSVIVDKVTASPTLYDGLREFCELAYRESSNVSVWIEEGDDQIRLGHRGSFPRSVSGQPEMAWWAIGMLVQVTRLFTGADWTPRLMAVPSQGPGTATAMDMFPGARFIPRPEVIWIAIPRRDLSRPAVRDPISFKSLAFADSATPPVDPIDSLVEFIELYLPDGAPRIDQAAEIAGTSVRTLQRDLGARHLTWSKLVSNVRFETARRLLDRSEMTVTEIAPQLGYSDSSHFARAFRRVAGASPGAYRRDAGAGDVPSSTLTANSTS